MYIDMYVRVYSGTDRTAYWVKSVRKLELVQCVGAEENRSYPLVGKQSTDKI